MKFTKKDCKEVCKAIGLKQDMCNKIADGIKHCIDNDITHLNIIVMNVYRFLETKYGDTPKGIKHSLENNIRKYLKEEELLLKLNFSDKLTPKRLFMLLLERYQH